MTRLDDRRQKTVTTRTNQAAFDRGQLAKRIAQGYDAQAVAVGIATDPRVVALYPTIQPGFIIPLGNVRRKDGTQLGFRIAPVAGKVWMEVGEKSDLDIAIVGAAYYERIDQEVIRWEERNRAHSVKVRRSSKGIRRRR